MESNGLKRKSKIIRLTVHEKLQVIEAATVGKTHDELANQFGIGRSTVTKILSKKQEYLDVASKQFMFTKKKIVRRDPILEEVERRMKHWIIVNTAYNIPLSQKIIQMKARDIYDEVEAISQENVPASQGSNSARGRFTASNGWFHNFVQREQLHCIKLKGEAGSADKEAAEKFPGELAEIIKEGGYSLSQIFNVDETGLMWKKMPERSFVSKNQGTASGQKAPKDRVTILFGGNADGSLKLKPLLIHKYEKPRALTGISRETLPVIYQSQNKAWMTSPIFVNWYREHFKKEVEEFCKKNMLPFRILLLMDNAPCHPDVIVNEFPEIKVVFFPPNTTSLIQPMDQGVISNFKSYYLRNTLQCAVAVLDAMDGYDKASVLKDFWKKFTIADVIRIVAASWKEVSQKAMAGVWKKIILPQELDVTVNIDQEIANFGCRIDPNITASEVNEYLRNHDAIPLTDEEIAELCEENSLEEECYEDCSQSEPPDSNIEDIVEAFNSLVITVQVLDRNFLRGQNVVEKIEGILEECYHVDYYGG